MFTQEIILMTYNKDVLCIMDKGKDPICKSVSKPNRRHNEDSKLPSHDPYIPRAKTVIYLCTTLECNPFLLRSITQLGTPDTVLKSCYYEEKQNDYECDTIKYHRFKNIDKLLFLKNSIPDKTFYIVDCLVYADGGRVCHKKDGAESQAKLVDTGTIARPNETYVLALDELICEEGNDKEINCDIDPFVPFTSGLKLKETAQSNGEVFLKSGPFVVLLSRNCVDNWCGYSGRIKVNRRRNYNYEPPGGKMYRCYRAKKQQVCKEVETVQKHTYRDENWLG